MLKFSYKFKIVLTLVALVLITSTMKAQIGFEDNVDDEVAAPINGLLWLLMIAGGSLGIFKLKKK
ncbi:hypothetical protein [Mesonia mobilis]|uniref:hypothetical protein n=1 Tax=Mesonia mobilis TaxID=369791 RepID=UPI0024BB7D66|nr:hypothetical protein [Mesonia mobilis]